MRTWSHNNMVWDAYFDNSEDPDEMTHNVAFHLAPYYFL